MKFTVFDKLTGEEADIIEIALKEGDWAKSLIYCDMEGFAIEEDGTLLLLDECGNFAYCPEDRFEVHIATMQEKDKEIAELKAEVSAWKETSQLLVKDGVQYNKQIAELKEELRSWRNSRDGIMAENEALALKLMELKSENECYKEVFDDHRRLVRELDEAMNGKDGMAKQASLCDLVSQIKTGIKIS